MTQTIERLSAGAAAEDPDSERRMVALVDAMPVAAYLTDDDGRIHCANRRLRALCADRTWVGEQEIAASFEAVAGDAEARLPAAASGAQVRSLRDGRRYRLQRNPVADLDGRDLVLNTLTPIDD